MNTGLHPCALEKALSYVCTCTWMCAHRATRAYASKAPAQAGPGTAVSVDVEPHLGRCRGAEGVTWTWKTVSALGCLPAGLPQVSRWCVNASERVGRAGTVRRGQVHRPTEVVVQGVVWGLPMSSSLNPGSMTIAGGSQRGPGCMLSLALSHS